MDVEFQQNKSTLYMHLTEKHFTTHSFSLKTFLNKQAVFHTKKDNDNNSKLDLKQG